MQDALDELRSERGSHFDPAVVDAFMTLVDDLDPLLLDVHSRRKKRPSSALLKPVCGPAPRVAWTDRPLA